MSTYHPKYFTTEAAHVPGNGLMSAQATIGGAPNNFRHFNRVKFNRCSDGASAALQNVVVKDSAGVPVGTATVFHDGDAIWEGLAHYLATAAGRDLGGGGDSYTDGNPDLPPLANATTILLAASSDASHWLIENADRLADLFHTIAPNAEVRIVVDGYFPPMLENEARYNANIGTNVFDGAWGNPLNELLPVGLSGTREYNETRYVMRATNGNSQSWLDRGVRIDADCVAQHGVGAEICYDQLHVLLNHVQTPFFIVADQRDLVVRDTPLYAVDPTYRFTENEYRRRVVDQALDVLSLYPTAACNPSSGWNTALFLARPDSRKHTHFDTDAKFGTTMSHCDGMATLATWTLSQALHSWLVFDTAFDAVERPGNGAGVHWVTAGHLCGAPQ
ncbi:MAG TPA: hypothetical protein VLQ93_01040 [Myxococcaceae bacterium]|nr:hypothetical protein [Myxococcaceae bacterium]